MTEVRVEKRFRHSRERVFDAFVDPLTVGQWLFRTPEGDLERADYDARAGGEFAIFERRGEMLARHFGRFIEVERPVRVIFDFWVDEAPEDPTRVTVTFAPEGDGCVVTLSHDLAPGWAAYAERTAAGWTMILDNLARVVAPD
ncbi:SRPBCC domain-containing protein [Brevundimonas sp.]|uniref:SRPBCC family protein n=1 Tax=Brevundimonas sp. TaxID=1871086 RepID=UPI0025E64D6B|nr:SRPBCC domain-containing protein [Brevundimonas sp.]